MKVIAAFMVFLYIVNIRAISVLKTLRRSNSVGDRHVSSGNDRFDEQNFDPDHENQGRYYGFKTISNFPYKQNASRSFFDMFTSSEGDSSLAQESSEEYFNPHAMYVGSYNDVNHNYSDIEGPDSGEIQYGVQPLSEELFVSTPATTHQRHITVPTLRSSVAGATKYCEEACGLQHPCHTPFCEKLSLSTLWNDCESHCLSFFLLFRRFLNML